MKWMLALLCWLPAAALDNGVTIYDASGGAQAGRPVVILRWFQHGEISGYAKPRVGGVPAAVWQCDVNSRWEDGSLRMAYVSWRQDLPAGGSVRADFVNDANRSSAGNEAATDAAALSQAQMLNFDTGGGAGSWGGVIEGSLGGLSSSADARAILAAGSWRYWLRGPAVTWAIVEDRGTALAYDFGWEYSGGSWRTPSDAKFKSLHPIFCLQFWPQAGGFAAWGGVEVDGILWNAATTRLQRLPLDELRLWTGAAASAKAYEQLNANFYARRTWHAVSWSGTAPAAAVVDFNLAYLTASRAILPYDTEMDYGATLADRSLTSYATSLGADKPEWCSYLNGCANWMKYVPSTGARGDIAPIPEWYMAYLFAMGSANYSAAKKLEVFQKLVVGNADAGSTYPVHYWESDNAVRSGPSYGARYFFDAKRSAPAFGHVVSLQARPLVGLLSGFESSAGAAADSVAAVCSADPCDGRVNPLWGAGIATYFGNWTPDAAHQGSMFFIPYLLTGRPFYLWEQQFMAGFLGASGSYARGNAAAHDAACRDGYFYGHWEGFGAYVQNTQFRAVAWALREIFLAAVLSPDAEPERDYFQERLRVNDAMWEGYFNVRNGLHAPADANCSGFSDATGTDPWCIGRKTFAKPELGANPLRTPFIGEGVKTTTGTGYDMTRFCTSYGNFQAPFFSDVTTWIARSGVLLQAGTPLFSYTRREAGRYMIEQVLHPDADGYWAGQYNYPSTVKSGGVGHFFSSWAELTGFLDRNKALDSAIGAGDSTFTLADNMWVWDNSMPGAVKIDNEWIQVCSFTVANNKYTMTVCSGGRGAWGTDAASHAAGANVHQQRLYSNSGEYFGGYTILHHMAHGLLTDVSSGSLSGRRSYEWYSGVRPGQNKINDPMNGNQSPQWALRMADGIRNLRVSPGTGSLTIRYTAPTGGTCKLAWGTAGFADSTDAGSASDGGGSRERVMALGGVAPGSVVKYRVTCGADRLYGEAATLGGAAAEDFAVQLRPPQGAGVVSAVVEHGAGDVPEASAGVVACGTGCRVVLSNLPAGTARRVWWKYLNPLGETVAAGGGTFMVGGG
jgi:hypothetical protein